MLSATGTEPAGAPHHTETSVIPSPPQTLPAPLYTAFTQRQKWLITFILGLTTIISPLTATIYFPLLPLLRSHFNTSAQAINVTITIYIIFQALSPLFFATLSDTFGRRPIYLITLTIYLLANLGLSLEQDSYAALLVLRALQSFGASAAFAVSYGVVADVCVPSERGKMLGPISAAQNLGTCVGPVVGGWVAWRSQGYGSVFWCLVVVGAVLLVTVGGFLTETAKNVVGDGSMKVEKWWLRTCWSGIMCITGRLRKARESKEKSKETRDANGGGDGDGPGPRQKKFKVFDFLACLRIIFWKDSALTLLMHGWFYLVDYCIQTAIPSAYKEVYHFNELLIGLSYLPRGAGIIIGGYVNGKMMDRKYRVTATEIGHTVDRVAGDDLDRFPIEKARARDSWYLFGVLSVVLVGYGWAIEKHAHVSIPLILQFVQGFLGTCLYTIFSTLLVDVFPDSPSTAAAAASITRCALAASGVAALQPLLDALGTGWYFTALGLVSGIFGSTIVWAIMTYGMKWRGERRSRSMKALQDPEPGEKGLAAGLGDLSNNNKK